MHILYAPLKLNDLDLSWKSALWRLSFYSSYSRYLLMMQVYGRLMETPYNGATRSVNAYLVRLSSVIRIT